MNARNSTLVTQPQTLRFEYLMRSWVARSLAVLVPLSIVVVAVAWGYDTYESNRVKTVYPPPGNFVQVGSARMHYICQGTGEPTLVLEAGIPGGVLDWTPVMPILAEHHRVCAFDRLGQDWSDPAPHPRTFSTAADELHSALQKLGIVRPVVVGHSFGGALVQVYAAKYDVVGVVLVDGVTTGVVDEFAQLLGGNQKWDPLARLGLMRQIMGILDKNPDYSPTTRAMMTALRSRSSAWLNMSDEGVVAQQSLGVELRAAELKLDVPLLILSAGKSNVMNLGVGSFAKSAQELAERKPNSTYVLFPNARHYLQAEHPQTVSDAIETWLATLK